MSKDPLNLIITGVGGQGNVIIALIVGNALVRKGYLVTIGETYGLSQRGGPVMSHLRISADSQYSPFIPDGHAHIILGMEPVETLRMLSQYGNPDVITIFNPRPIYSIDVTSGSATYPKIEQARESIKSLSSKTWIVNATEEAQKMGNPIFANMILIGALLQTGVLPLDRESVETAIQEMFPKEVETNLAALNKGMELVAS
ncbi:MAG: indolepyruvate ferredoxin oxidoreductase [Chloroflexi bacterium]|nr:indolepyruvate ferredoxin oxidoreductase [Chloroflexota bacterium]MBM4450750.1 indolepyruvate ferredoxin oxidoreductase [Chloroflexota bacterium]